MTSGEYCVDVPARPCLGLAEHDIAVRAETMYGREPGKPAILTCAAVRRGVHN